MFVVALVPTHDFDGNGARRLGFLLRLSLVALATDILESPGKVMIMNGDGSGLQCLLELLEGVDLSRRPPPAP